jgi:hypothetical protein
MLSQPNLHCTSRQVFKQHWRHLKGNYAFNSAFEKADRLLEQKRTGCQLHYIAPLTLVMAFTAIFLIQ